MPSLLSRFFNLFRIMESPPPARTVEQWQAAEFYVHEDVETATFSSGGKVHKAQA